MSSNLRIAVRFLTAKKRSMLMSLACIVLGVGLFIVTQATTGGFEQFFINTILGTNGAIRLEDRLQPGFRTMTGADRGAGFSPVRREGYKYIGGIAEPGLLIAALRKFPNVSGASPVLRGAVIMKSGFANETAQIYGINLDEHLAVSNLAGQIVRGGLGDFRNAPAGALVGRVLADRLQLDLGDSFILEAQGEARRYRVSALYETGVSDLDRLHIIYLHLGEARSLLRKPSGASFIQVGLFDQNRAPADAAQMEEVLGHSAASWQQREKTWLDVFRALRISAAITVSVFTLIAGLAMFNTLAMIVMERTKEIAILRSMGYTRRDVSRIFLWQAAIVLVLGAVLGWILGAGGTYAVSHLPIRIRGIFTADTFIVSWSPWHYVIATATAAVVVIVASLVPARRAARLEPGDVIRGTAS